MEVRLLNTNELKMAEDTAKEVYQNCVVPYAKTQSETDQFYRYCNADYFWAEQCKKQLYLWGIFENGQMCAVSAMQAVGHITMLYVKPFCQHRGYACMLLNVMEQFAATELHLNHVTLNATPAASAVFFKRRGFLEMNMQQFPEQFISMDFQLMNPDGTIRTSASNVYVSQQENQTSQNQNYYYQNTDQKNTTQYNGRPTVTYQTKKINAKIIVTIVVATLAIIFAIGVIFALFHLDSVDEESGVEVYQQPEVEQTPYTVIEPETETETEVQDTEGTEGDSVNGYVTLGKNLGVEMLVGEDHIYIAQDLNYDVVVEQIYVVEEPEKGRTEFQISYPQIQFKDGSDATAVNQMLRDAACTHYDQMYPEVDMDSLGSSYDADYPYLVSNVDYEITYMSNDLISVAYGDHYYLGSQFLECSDLRTRVINVKTGERYDIENVLNHDAALDELFYQRICEIDEEFVDAPAFDVNIVSETLSGEIPEGRYFSNYALCSDGIKMNLTFHYGDGNLIMRGWIDTWFTNEELESYRTDSEMWNLYQY